MIFSNTLVQVGWTAPVSNRLLFEAHASRFPQGNPRDYQPEAVAPSITELSTFFTYRSGFKVLSPNTTDHYRFTASYVTGAHALKVGFHWVYEDMHSTIAALGDVRYTALNGIPIQVSYFMPIDYFVYLHNRSAFVQDRWTIRRLTLNAGVRLDRFNSVNDAIDLPPAQYFPFRLQFPKTDVAIWKDLSPRFGGAYDLFGNAKTALKASVGRAVNQEGIDLSTLANPLGPSGCCGINPIATRSWSDVNGDRIVQGDPFNAAANGELGPGSNLNFGRTFNVNRLESRITRGFGTRGYNWEATAGIEHELLPRVSVDFSYFWRWFGNFIATDNLAIAPTDFSSYCITAPRDPRLPGGGGHQICDLYDVNPNVFGRIDNLVTAAGRYGKQREHWNGFDLAINARLPTGVLLQGGVSSGSTMRDNCDVVTKLDNPSTLYCHNEEPYLMQVKFLGSYPLPWWGLQTSATFRSEPGAPVSANYVATSASIRPSLGRDLSSGSSGVAVVNVIEPNTVFGDRINQLDFRLAKTFTAGRARVMGTVDFYNALNANTIRSWNNSYGTNGAAWLRPLAIMSPRLIKFSARVDF